MTIRELETDGVPAPSDIELAAMDAHPRRLDFNGAAKALHICRDRERFHRWAGKMINLSVAYTEDDWWTFYRAFVQFEDTRDEYNERNHIDGHDESLDPHLDAFV